MKPAPLLLKDYSNDIPPFLRRTPDGRLMYPNVPAPLLMPESYRLVTTATDNDKRRVEAAKERDRRTAEAIVRAAEQEQRARREQSSAEAAAKRKLDRDRKNQIKTTQRKNFIQHFRWEWEK